MKKLVTVLGIMCLSVAVYADTISPRLSLNFPGTHKLDIAGVADTDTQMSGAIGAEYMHAFNDMFAAGAGAQYTFDTKGKDVSAAFNFLPVYLTGTYTPPIKNLGQFAPYAKANLGYNVLFNGNDAYKSGSDLKGGMYWAAGIGTKFMKNYSADIMYSSYLGKRDIANFTGGDTTYSTVALSIGYAFGL